MSNSFYIPKTNTEKESFVNKLEEETKNDLKQESKVSKWFNK